MPEWKQPYIVVNPFTWAMLCLWQWGLAGSEDDYEMREQIFCEILATGEFV